MTFNCLIQSLVLAILTSSALATLRTGRKYALLRDDVINLDVANILSHKYHLDNIDIQETNLNVDKPQTIRQLENIEDNDEGRMMNYEEDSESTVIIDTETHKNFALLLYKQNDQIKLFITEFNKEGPKYKPTYSSKLFVPNHLRCTRLAIDDDTAYGACISKLEKNVQICANKYKTDLITECKYYNVDYDFTFAEMDELVVDLEIYVNNQGQKVMFLYFKNSPIDYFKRKFFMIIEGNEKMLKVNLERFVIDKIKVVSYSEDMRYVSCLVSSTNRDQKQLYHMLIRNEFIDQSSLAEGSFKNKLRTFDYNNKVALLYEENHANNQILITALNVNDMTHTTVDIQKQLSVKRAIMGHDLAIIETLTVNYVKELYVYNISNGRLSKLDLALKDTEYWTLILVKRLNVIVVFDLRTNSFKYYSVLKFPQINIRHTGDQEDKRGMVKFNILDEKHYKISIKYNEADKTFPPLQNNFKTLPYDETLIKLHYLKNNAQFADANVKYFDPLKVKASDNLIEKCKPLYWVFVDHGALMFCSNNSMLAFESYAVEEKSLLLKSGYTFKLYPGLDLSTVRGTRIYFKTYVIIMTVDLKLHIFNMAFAGPGKEMRLHQIDLKKADIEDCHFNSQGIRCNTSTRPTKYIWLHLKIKKSGIHLYEMNLKNVADGIVNNNFHNSYFNRFVTFEMLLDVHANQYIIVFRNKQRSFNLFRKFPIKLTDKTRLYQLNNNDILVHVEHPNELLFFVISEGSYLSFPLDRYLKGFKKIVTFVFNHNSSFFVLFYRTIDDKIRGVLLKSSWHYANRIISEFYVDESCDKVKAFLEVTAEQDILVTYLCKEPHHLLRAFYLYHNGPFVSVPPTTTSQNINVAGDEFYEAFFDSITPVHVPLSAKAENFVIKESESKSIEIDLETSKHFTVQGNVQDIRLNSKSPFIELHKRGHPVEDIVFDIKTNEDKGITPFPNLKALLINNNFSLLYGSSLYRHGRVEENMFFADCYLLTATYIDDVDIEKFSSYFLCKSSVSQQFYITNLKDYTKKIPVDIIEPNARVYDPYLMKIHRSVFIVLRIGEDKIFQVLKFFVSGNDFKIVNSHFINAKTLSTLSELVGVADYFATYIEARNEIALFFHPAFTNQLNIVFINAKDNTVDHFKQELIEFFDAERLDFYSSKFIVKDDNKITVFITTLSHIYEIDLIRNETFEYSIKDMYSNPKGNSVKGNHLAVSDDYVVLLYAREKSMSNVLIYQRDDDIHTNQLYTTINQRDFKSEDYTITALELDKSNGQTFMYLIYYEGKLASGGYEKMRMKTLIIDTLKLKLNPKKLSHRETIELHVLDVDNNIQIVPFEITLFQNYKIFMFTVIFLILILLFFALLVLIVLVYRENERLKREILEELQERGELSESSRAALTR